ncbi:MAG: GTPase HflX [Myxococcales bacterium]|nr:GTPase HflX [Myxococcales bacterium]
MPARFENTDHSTHTVHSNHAAIVASVRGDEREVAGARREAILFVRYREVSDPEPESEPQADPEVQSDEADDATASVEAAPEPPSPAPDGALPVSIRELAALLRGLGIAPVDVVHRRRMPGRGGALVGDAKLAELAAVVEGRRRPGAPEPLVVVDGQLRPGQRRAIAAATGAEVIDRSDVILRVFAARARTRIARCEVELAQIAYTLPQIRDDDVASDAEGGGGRGARGHTNLTLRKERLLERQARIRRDLEGLRRAAADQRARREGLPRVALVGYTNAGKSSWMRALTGDDVGVDDRLFATIDTTVRRLAGVEGPPELIADTVGFIRELPHGLVESFRSTLAETREAELIVHVVDADDPERAQHIEVTRAVLAEIGAEAPTILVLNKADRVAASARIDLRARHPEALLLSAHEVADVDALRAAILGHVDRGLVAATLLVPHGAASLLGELYAEARVSAAEFVDAGVRVVLRAEAAKIDAWRRRLADDSSAPTEG